MQSSEISDSRRDKERKRAFCLIGRTKHPWPVTIRNWVSCDLRREPEMRSASLGAGTCQKNMMGPPGSDGQAIGVTVTVRPDRQSTSTTFAFLLIGSSGHASQASASA